MKHLIVLQPPEDREAILCAPIGEVEDASEAVWACFGKAFECPDPVPSASVDHRASTDVIALVDALVLVDALIRAGETKS